MASISEEPQTAINPDGLWWENCQIRSWPYRWSILWYDTKSFIRVDFGAAASVHIIRFDHILPTIQIHSNLNRQFRRHDRNLRSKGISLSFVCVVVSDSEPSFYWHMPRAEAPETEIVPGFNAIAIQEQDSFVFRKCTRHCYLAEKIAVRCARRHVLVGSYSSSFSQSFHR